MVSEPPGRYASEPIMASKVLNPEGRALNLSGEGSLERRKD